MKKLNRIFLLLVLLLWGYGLSLSASQPEFSATAEMQQEVNSLQSKRRNLHQNYMMIWIQYQNETPNSNNSTENFPMNSGPLPPSTQNSPALSKALQDLLSQGGSLFETLDNQLAELQEQLMNSETTIINLQTLLLEAKGTITQLSENLAKAQIWADQMGQRLQENNEDLAAAYDHLDLLNLQNATLKIEAEKYWSKAQRNGLIGFGFAGVGFGVGTPLMIEGIQSDNQTMLWTGAGTIIGTTGIWLLGHYVFHWW